MPASISVTDFTRTVEGVQNVLGAGTMGDYVGVDHERWKEAVGFDDFVWCGAECGAQSPAVNEKINSVYAMAEFTFDELRFPVRGDIGVRYVGTDQDSVGFIPTAAAEGSPYVTVAQRVDVSRQYEDLLPSVNLVVELTPSLQGRISVAGVMSRPDPGRLIPRVT